MTGETKPGDGAWGERAPSPAGPPRSATRASLPEDPVDDRTRATGRPEVVVDQLVGGTGPIAQDAGHRGALAGVAGQLVAALAGDEGDRVADPADRPPGPVERFRVGV